MKALDASEAKSLLTADGKEPFATLQVVDFPWIPIIFSQPTTAVRSTTLALTGLARNAVIRSLDVRLKAAPADLTPLGVAQVRTNEIRGNLLGIIVDFGTMVTISGIRVEPGEQGHMGVYRVQAWNGTAFASPFHYTPLIQGFSEPTDGNFLPDKLAPVRPSTANEVVFASEVRTQKLQIVVVSDVSADRVVAKLALHLPDAPSGLELVTDAGLRLFYQAAPVVRVGAQEVSDLAWNVDYERIVHLAPLLAGLAGDPVSHDPLAITLTLSTQAPGVLEIERETSDIQWLERLPLGPDGTRSLSFSEEGQTSFTVSLDATYDAAISAKLQALGKPRPERVLPPLGPTPIPDIDLVLTPELAMACRVPVSGLISLTGVRLALAAGVGGAEVKVIALEDDAGEPGAPIEGAESAPVTLLGGGTAVTAPWMTFPLATPIDLTHTPSPWIAILVARGKLAWSMGQYSDSAAALPVRRGPAAGPWVRLPSMFNRTAGFLDLQGLPLDLTRLGARVRAIGLPSPDAPIAPYRFALTATASPLMGATEGVPVTPTAKGTVVEWAPTSPLPIAGNLTVQVVSYVADALTLLDLDVTLTK
jgi:hypothetical protein